MKKIIYLLSIIFLLLQSCSSGDNNSANTNQGVLVKKIIYIGDYADDFIYDSGNKLSKIVHSNGGYIKFTYSGNLITKMEWMNNIGIVIQYNTYTYSNNNLIEIKTYSSQGLEANSIYTYNLDGTISINSRTRGTTNGVVFWNETITKNYFDSVGNLIKKVGPNGTNILIYDSKNNPIKNIVGFNILDQSINNIIKETGSNNSYLDTYSYEYNSLNYPISYTRVNSGSTTHATFTYY